MHTHFILAALTLCLAAQPLLGLDPYSGDYPATPLPTSGGSATVGGYYDYYNGPGTDSTMYVAVTTTRPRADPSAAFNAWESQLMASTSQALANSGYVGQVTGFMPYSGGYDPEIYQAASGTMRAHARPVVTLLKPIFVTTATIDVTYTYDQATRQILQLDPPSFQLQVTPGSGAVEWIGGPPSIAINCNTAIITYTGTLRNTLFGIHTDYPFRIEVTATTFPRLQTTVNVTR
jgi:hypothetical protein